MTTRTARSSSGLTRKFSAPARIASTAISMEPKAVITTKTASMPLSLASRSSVSPSIRGIRTSARTRSAPVLRNAASASTPSPASLTE